MIVVLYKIRLRAGDAVMNLGLLTSIGMVAFLKK
jgi:hypothetical protein